MTRARRHIPVSDVGCEAGAAGLRQCDHPDCGLPGDYRAPRSQRKLDDYYWFCLDHVRAYNAAWDFFAGMSQADIERFQRDMMVGHRPTWRLGDRCSGRWPTDGVRDAFGIFGNGIPEERNGDAAMRRMDPRQRKALSELDLDATATLKEIKMRYKQLVKRFHPDANGGDKGSEERFKAISAAYTYLLSCGPS